MSCRECREAHFRPAPACKENRSSAACGVVPSCCTRHGWTVSEVHELALTEIAICSDYSTLCHVGSAGKRTFARRPLARRTGLLLLVASFQAVVPDTGGLDPRCMS